MEPYTEDNILVDELKKGLPYSLTVESTDIAFDHDEIMADIKYENRIEAPAIIHLQLGEGVTATETELTIYLTDVQTRSLKARHTFMDVKGKRTGQEPELLFTAKIFVRETITDI